MRIALFIPTYNEAFTLDQVLSYYKKNGVTDIFVFDNGSTDETLQIAMRHGAHIEETIAPSLDDRNYLHIKNDVWKKYRRDFDFVICCDADEVLYHPKGLLNALKEETASVIRTSGWNVYSDLPPDLDNILKVSTGFFDDNFSKYVCFDPKRIESMNYVWGAHNCNPRGDVVFSQQEYYLLHVRCLGGVQRMIDRHQEYAARMSEFNRVNGLGFHYLRTQQQILEEWDKNTKRSKPAPFINDQN